MFIRIDASARVVVDTKSLAFVSMDLYCFGSMVAKWTLRIDPDCLDSYRWMLAPGGKDLYDSIDTVYFGSYGVESSWVAASKRWGLEATSPRWKLNLMGSNEPFESSHGWTGCGRSYGPGGESTRSPPWLHINTLGSVIFHFFTFLLPPPFFYRFETSERTKLY